MCRGWRVRTSKTSPIAPPPKARRSAFEGSFAPPCRPAGRFPSGCRRLGLRLGRQRACAARGPRFHVLMNMQQAPLPTRAAEGTSQRLRPVKAAGPAAKIARRGSCTCLFSNRAGLSEFTKPGRVGSSLSSQNLEPKAERASQSPPHPRDLRGARASARGQVH